MRTCALLSTLAITLCAQQPTVSADREMHWKLDLQAMASALKAPGIRIAGGIATKGQKDFAQLYPQFDGELASIVSDLPRLTDAEVLLRLMKLIASAHVGHNRIQIPSGMGFANRLPVNFHWFADGLAVSAATEEWASTLGARVLAIGGVEPEHLLRVLEPYISYENDATLHADSPGLMNAAGVLRHFGMVADDGTVPLRLQKTPGETITVSMPLVPAGERIAAVQGLHLTQPMARSRNGYYWHEYLSGSHTLYVQYNVCANDPKERFRDFVRNVFADADAHPVKCVVLDLRNNGGGDEHVIGPLKDGLAARARKLGPLYVLIGPATFSSAVDNAGTLRREFSAKLVGEPSGGMPGGYGEVNMVTLPNSKLVVRFTTKGSPPKGGEPVNLIPDILAPLNLQIISLAATRRWTQPSGPTELTPRRLRRDSPSVSAMPASSPPWKDGLSGGWAPFCPPHLLFFSREGGSSISLLPVTSWRGGKLASPFEPGGSGSDGSPLAFRQVGRSCKPQSS